MQPREPVTRRSPSLHRDRGWRRCLFCGAFIIRITHVATDAEDRFKGVACQRHSAHIRRPHFNSFCHEFDFCIGESRRREILRLILHFPNIHPDGAACVQPFRRADEHQASSAADIEHLFTAHPRDEIEQRFALPQFLNAAVPAILCAVLSKRDPSCFAPSLTG